MAQFWKNETATMNYVFFKKPFLVTYNGLGRRGKLNCNKIILKVPVPVELPYSLNTKELPGSRSTHSVLSG